MVTGKQYKERFLNGWKPWKKVNFQGYNYGGIIANHLADLYHKDVADSGKNYSVSHGLKALILGIFFTDLNPPVSKRIINNKETGSAIGFVMDDDNREDYLRQCAFFIEQLNGYNLSIFDIHKNAKPRTNFVASALLSKIALITKLLFTIPLSSAFKHNSVAKNLYLFRKCLLYFDVIRHIQKKRMLDGLDALVVFSDMKQYGNIFVQAARKQHIVTATLQHGIYIKHKDEYYSQSAINYLNSNADYLLGWGKGIIPVFKVDGQPEKKILLSGTSVNEYRIENYYSAISGQDVKVSNTFVVLFSRTVLRESNRGMLNIANQVAQATGMKFNVLMHPNNKEEDYSFEKYSNLDKAYKNSSMLINLIEDSAFCICHATTVYFTSLLKGKVCFRYKDDMFIDYGGLDDTFDNADHLLEMVNNRGQISKAMVESLLVDQFGEKTFSYKQSVDFLLSKAV